MTAETLKCADRDSAEDPLTRFRHADDPILPGPLAHLEALERALQAKGFPAMSPWWRGTLIAFYAGSRRQLVLRVGRRGGKSSTLCRVAVLEALYGDHIASEGDLRMIAIVSVSRQEANRRLRMIRAILLAIGVEAKSSEQGSGLELVDRGVAFVVFAASIGGVSGFSCICAICDEVAKWKDVETGVNPATEVLASLRPTLAGQPNAKLFLSSSAMGTRDAHGIAFDLGETAFQSVAMAETWIARPDLTEEDCRQLEPDEETFAREYGCIPFDGSTAALFNRPALMAVTREGITDIPPEEGSSYVAAQDPANRGGNGWTLAIARAGTVDDGVGAVQVVCCREWRAVRGASLDSDATLAEIGGVLMAYGVRELWSDQWSFDALAALAVRHGIELRQEASTQASNVQGFDALKRRVNDRTVELPDDPAVRSDLLGVSRWISKGGAFSIELERAGSRHSDYAPAIALVVAKASEICLPAWMGNLLVD